MGPDWSVRDGMLDFQSGPPRRRREVVLISWVAIGAIAGLLTRRIVPGPDSGRFAVTVRLKSAGASDVGSFMMVPGGSGAAGLKRPDKPPTATDCLKVLITCKDRSYPQGPNYPYSEREAAGDAERQTGTRDRSGKGCPWSLSRSTSGTRGRANLRRGGFLQRGRRWSGGRPGREAPRNLRAVRAAVWRRLWGLAFAGGVHESRRAASPSAPPPVNG